MSDSEQAKAGELGQFQEGQNDAVLQQAQDELGGAKQCEKLKVEGDASEQVKEEVHGNALQDGAEQEQPKPSSYGNDEMPIGGKSKFQIDEYPPEGGVQVALPRKKATKAVKKPLAGGDSQKENVEVQLEKQSSPPPPSSDISPPVVSYGNDEQPIGSKGKFQIDEYPPEGEQPQKKPVAKKPAGKKDTKKQVQPKPIEDAEQLPVGGGAQMNQFDELPVGGKKNEIDEMPIGGGQKFDVSEYPEGAEGAGDDGGAATVLPLATRMKSKVWKQRMSAFEEMAELFRTDAASCEPYYEEWPKLVADNNPGSQERALAALEVFIKMCDQRQFQARVDGRELVKVLIEKCVTPGKPQIRKLSFEILGDVLERKEKVEVFEACVSMLQNKNQKVVCAAIQTVCELLQQFGPKRLDFLKPFFGEIEKQAASTVSSIRNECMTFYKEAFRWLGEQVLQPFIAKLKKAQLDELEKFFKECEVQPMVPLRGGQAVEVKAQGGAAIDAYDIVDAVDIFTKFNEKWCDKVLALSKWNEKTAQLEEIIKTASVPKLAPSNNYSPILSLIKKLLADSNANVNIAAIKLSGVLVKGLRRNFSQQAKLLFPLLIPKFRDKKTLMIEETKLALDHFVFAVAVEDIIEDLKEGLNDKVPQMKVHLLSFISKAVIARSQQTNLTKSKPFIDCMKQLVPIIKRMLEDSVPEVRESSILCLGKIKPFLSEPIINQNFADVTGQKLARINEIAAQQIEESRPKQPLQQQQQQQQKSPLGDTQSAQKKPPLQPATTSTIATTTIAATNNVAVKVLQPFVEEGCKFEESEFTLRQAGVPEDFFSQMDGGPKEKVLAINELQNCIDAVLYNFDAVLVYLRRKTKDWKESNLQVVKEVFALLNFADGLDPKPFSKRSFPSMARFLIEKAADSKFSKDVYRLFESACEWVPAAYMVSFLIVQAKPREENDKLVNVPPKTVAEIIVQITKIISLVTLRHIEARELTDFAKEQVIQTNAIVKAAAIELLKLLYSQIGVDFKALLADIPLPIMKTLDSEFASMTLTPTIEPKIQFHGDAAAVQQKKQQPASNNVKAEQLPRTDISKDMERIIKKLNDGQWNKRKEGIEELDRLISASGNRISINGLSELFNVVKAKLGDQNKGVIRSTIALVGRLADACGKDFKTYGKQIVPGLINYLSDKQVLVRQDAVQSLEKIGLAIGSDQIIALVPGYLGLENQDIKLELMQYVLKNPEGFQRSDVKLFIQPLLTLLCDRAKEVRQAAEQVSEKAIEEIGVEAFSIALKDVKQAVREQLRPILGKYGVEFEEEQKPARKPGKTPVKNKQQQDKSSTSAIVGQDRRLKRIMTTKDLQNTSVDSHNNNLNNSMNEFKSRTPKKQNNLNDTKRLSTQKILPNDFHQSTPKVDGRVKPVFLEGALIASQVSVRELKSARVVQESDNWLAETFAEVSVNETYGDLRVCLKPELFSLLTSADYRQVITGLSLLAAQCNENNMNKMSLIELSDLMLKWSLMKVYGQCCNPPLLEAIQRFLGAFLTSLDSINYQLLDLETFLAIKFMREVVYSQTALLDRIPQCLLKMGGAEKVVKMWIRILITDQGQIHAHLRTDVMSQYIQREVIRVLQTSMINGFTQETLLDLMRFPYIKQFPEFISELVKIYGEPKLRKVGLVGNSAAIPATNTSLASLDQFSLLHSQKPSSASTQHHDLSPGPQSQPSSPRSTQFASGLTRMLSDNTSAKIEALMQFNDVLGSVNWQSSSPTSYPLYLFVNQAQSICRCFHSLLVSSFQQREQMPTQFIQFLLQAIQKLYTIRPYVQTLPFEPLCGFTEDLLQRLLLEDETKSHFEQGDAIVKQLNSTTLRILENAETDMIFCVLLDLLIKHRRKQQGTAPSKMLGLVVKCLVRITKTLEQSIQSVKVDLLLLKCHNYTSEFSTYPNFTQEEQGIKTIKTILQEIVKLQGNRVWDAYQIVQRSDCPDQYIHQWIKQIQQQNPNTVSRLSFQNENFQAEQELKQAVDLIKATRQSELGIARIVEIVRKNPGISWQSQTTECGPQVQMLIQNQLEVGNQRSIRNSFRGSDQLVVNNNNMMKTFSSFTDEPQVPARARQQQQQQLDARSTQQFQQQQQQQQQQQGPQQLRTPEYLMQRLNDMKNKVQTLVGGTTQPGKFN